MIRSHSPLHAPKRAGRKAVFAIEEREAAGPMPFLPPTPNAVSRLASGPCSLWDARLGRLYDRQGRPQVPCLARRPMLKFDPWNTHCEILAGELTAKLTETEGDASRMVSVCWALP